ncbi:MAG: hypothetical protein PHE68_02250 [Candidatus Peribacteraceae bacterium]|nr:hypothetical protein [Candidatus Peribacteraceae bacterium]MDD5074936.1 hypothetical protein [Candidatus Peribacteraceae bacterium]
MSTHPSTTELRTMQLPDLLKELKAQELTVEQLRLGIQQQKEKDTARYRREKKVLAQMKTELQRKRREQLQAPVKNSTVPVSKS